MREFDGSVAAPTSPLSGMDPLAKLCGAVGAVVALATFPADGGWRYGAVLALLAGLWLAARVPLAYLGRRWLAATPFILMAALLPLASAADHALTLAVSVVLKAYAAILLLSLLGATTPIEGIIESLQRLGAPRGLGLTAILMHRYLFVLLAEWRRVARARECRTGGRVTTGRTRVWANQAAMVFVRGWERAERVAQAMLARGFRGEFPRLRPRHQGLRELALGLALPAAVLVLRLV